MDVQLATDDARLPTAYVLGLIAGLALALVYGLCAEVLGLSWGLLVVAVVGGTIVGGAVGRGAWAGSAHVRVRQLQAGAAVIGGVAWLIALVLAYVFSQALIPQATTGLLERISVGGFADYFGGTFDFVRLIHLVGLALITLMAWRGAR